ALTPSDCTRAVVPHWRATSWLELQLPRRMARSTSLVRNVQSTETSTVPAAPSWKGTPATSGMPMARIEESESARVNVPCPTRVRVGAGVAAGALGAEGELPPPPHPYNPAMSTTRPPTAIFDIESLPRPRAAPLCGGPALGPCATSVRGAPPRLDGRRIGLLVV